MNRDERTTATLYAARCNVEVSEPAGRAKDGERDESAAQEGERAKRKRGTRVGRRDGMQVKCMHMHIRGRTVSLALCYYSIAIE